MTRILVTGASGFIGANMARALVNKGDDVTALVRTDTDLWRIKDIQNELKIKVCSLLDTAKIASVAKEANPEVVIHLAGAGVASNSQLTESELAQTNFVGLVNLISALEPVNYKRFINVGSVFEYGNKRIPAKEIDTCEPMNMYAVTKLAGTRYSSYVGMTRGKPIVTFRLCSVYGPYDDQRRITARTMLSFLRNKDVKHANPLIMRDFIYIEDVVRLFFEAIENTKLANGEIYNVGTGEGHTMEGVVNIIHTLGPTTSNVSWGDISARLGESSVGIANMTKTFSTFDWRPHYSLAEGMIKMYEWMKEHQDLYKPLL